MALGAALAAAVAIAVVALSGGGGSAPKATAISGVATARVERRDLVATDTESGTLGYAGSRPVVNHLTGTATWLPEVGRVVHPGQVLYEVDSKPVVLFDGGTPAYRTLAAGVGDGVDVLELERNLVSLGFGPLTVDGHFDSATTQAVKHWQSSTGLSQSGRVGFGRVVFLPGARRVKSVSATIGGSVAQSGGAGNSGSSGASSSGGSTGGASLKGTGKPTVAAAVMIEPAPAPAARGDAIRAASLRTKARTGGSTSPPSKRQSGQGQSQQTPGSGPTGNSNSGSNGNSTGNRSSGSSASGSGGGGSASRGSSARSSAGGGASGTAGGSSASASASNTIMTTTSTRSELTVKLDATKQTLARTGDKVSVQLPDNSVADGHISGVGRVASSSSSSSSSSGSSGSSTASSTVPVTIRLSTRRRITSLDQATVTVNFAQQRRRNVLAIPVTALLATAGGGYGVEVVEGRVHRLVPVTPGLYAGGYVEISGSGIAPGTRVTNASA